MPCYLYKCPHCKTKPVEVMHEMKFIGNEKDLPRDILEQIVCHTKICKAKEEQTGALWKRIPQEPQLMGSSEGTFLSEDQLRKKKQAQRKVRSKIHFKNEILPKMNETAKIKDHFKNSVKHLPNKDHEKMK